MEITLQPGKCLARLCTVEITNVPLENNISKKRFPEAIYALSQRRIIPTHFPNYIISHNILCIHLSFVGEQRMSLPPSENNVIKSIDFRREKNSKENKYFHDNAIQNKKAEKFSHKNSRKWVVAIA